MLRSATFAQLSHFRAATQFLPWSATYTQLWLILGFLALIIFHFGANWFKPLITHNLFFPKFVVVCPKIVTSCFPTFDATGLEWLDWWRCSIAYSTASLSWTKTLFPKISNFCTSLAYIILMLCCSLPKFAKVPKDQSNILHPKMCKTVCHFGATFRNFLRNLCRKFSATFGLFERNFLGGINQ